MYLCNNHIICSVFFSRPTVAMLFGAVAWYCTLVPYQTFAQQDAYEALSRYMQHTGVFLLRGGGGGGKVSTFGNFSTNKT